MKGRIERKNSRWISCGSCLLLALTFFVMASPVSAATEEAMDASFKMSSVSIIYGVVCAISFLTIIGYCCFIKEKSIWFVFLTVAVFICNAGYFALSMSRSLGEALLANRIAYFGSVFLVLFMLIIIMDSCNINIRKLTVVVLTCVSVAVFFIAGSGGYSDVYYEEVSFALVNGSGKLIKEYGSLHCIYYVYLFVYIVLMILTIVFAVRKKKISPYKHAAFFAAVALGNMMIWLIEQMIRVDFEFLSVSYVITEMLVIFLCSILQDYTAYDEADSPVPLDSAPADSGTLEQGTPELALDIDMAHICDKLPELRMLTAREMEVLKPILEDKKRREIAEELGITDHTVKKHTSNIFAKLGVSSRKELYAKIKGQL